MPDPIQDPHRDINARMLHIMAFLSNIRTEQDWQNLIGEVNHQLFKADLPSEYRYFYYMARAWNSNDRDDLVCARRRRNTAQND